MKYGKGLEILTTNHPTGPFTTLELQNTWHDIPKLRKLHRSPIFLRKSGSGSQYFGLDMYTDF